MASEHRSIAKALKQRAQGLQAFGVAYIPSRPHKVASPGGLRSSSCGKQENFSTALFESIEEEPSGSVGPKSVEMPGLFAL